MAMTIVEGTRAITGGVDTHLDVHVAAALDDIGGLLGVESFEASAAGNDKLRSWLASFGDVARVGVEGTGSYGASLARFLRGARIEVVEVDRRTAKRDAGRGSPIRPTPLKPLGLRCRGELRVWARPGTATSRPSGLWWWRSGRRSRRESNP
jgi:hypothetical protein